LEVKNILIINKLIIKTMNEEQKEILGKIKVLLEELESNNSTNDRESDDKDGWTSGRPNDRPNKG